MNCPDCGVRLSCIETRQGQELETMRRRYLCHTCGLYWQTVERFEIWKGQPQPGRGRPRKVKESEDGNFGESK